MSVIAIPTWLRHDMSKAVTPITQSIILAAGVIGLSLILVKQFRAHAMEQSQEWTRKLPHAHADSLRPTFTARAGVSSEEARLAAQTHQIRARANLHLRVMNYFYSRYFASITLAMLMGIAAAACLLHITAVGWRSANRYIAAVFLATAAMAFVFRVSPVLYKQEENIAANKDLYTRYVMLDNEIESYLATTRFRSTDSVPVAEVIQRIDSAMFSLRDLPIGFDRTQIPDYQKLQFIDGK